jgi:hypothetical protein
MRHLHKVSGEVRDGPEQLPLSLCMDVTGEQEVPSLQFDPEHQRTVVLGRIGLVGTLPEGRTGVQYEEIHIADERSVACRYLSQRYPPLSDDILELRIPGRSVSRPEPQTSRTVRFLSTAISPFMWSGCG